MSGRIRSFAIDTKAAAAPVVQAPFASFADPPSSLNYFPPWNECGVELHHPETAEEAIKTAGLGYVVAKKPLGSVMRMRLRQDDWATIRRDTGDVLGIVNDDYEVIQNTEAFVFFDTLIREQEATYEMAGALGRGEQAWVLAKLRGDITVNSKDIVNKYLLLTNSHDGHSHIEARVAPIRVVCNNSLTAALKGAGEISIHHTFDATRNVRQAHDLLRLANALYHGLDSLFNRMATTEITEQQLTEYLDDVAPVSEVPGIQAWPGGFQSEIRELQESALVSKAGHWTPWGAFNSVCEYTDHLLKAERPDQRLKSIWFGQGEQMKLRAFRLAERLNWH